MTARFARLAVWGVVALALGARAVTVLAWADVETDVVLRDNGRGECVVTGKATEIAAKKGQKIAWRILNRCTATGKGELVTIGNFRTSEASSNGDCLRATEGAVWPFRESDGEIRFRRHSTKIELHVKKPAELPSVYHFDICTGGEQANRKSDPRLVIEP